MRDPDVLLVDDSALVTEALRVLLSETGHRVRTAGSVAAAIAAARESVPDVLLLDLTLPDGDGLLVLERLRERGRPVPRTAAMTGHDDPATARRCAEAGCVATLTKPVPTRELLRRVEEWTG